MLPLDSAQPGTVLPVHLVEFESQYTVTASGLSVPKVCMVRMYGVEPVRFGLRAAEFEGKCLCVVALVIVTVMSTNNLQ